MDRRTLPILLILFSISSIIFACNLPFIPAGETAIPTPAPVEGKSVTAAETAFPKVTEKPAASVVPAITGVEWDPGGRLVQVGIDPWPTDWTPWTMIVDGKEYPAEDESSGILFRPNAPLSAPPDGILIGTAPWASGLDRADFPCCGTLQFDVPGMGLTNSIDYSLVDEGCATASAKACTSEWTTHDGDWTIQGSQTETIENTKLIQRGNIYIKDSGSLILRNSELRLEAGDSPTVHIYIIVDPGATLVVDHSSIHPGPEGGLDCVFNYGTVTMTDSPTRIHYFDMSGNARLTMDNSEMLYDIGGLLQVTGGSTNVTNSKLGALGLAVPAGARLEATGLKSGMTFTNWKVQDLIQGANYELTLDNVSVLKDELQGELKYGPYERGWIFFLDPASHVRLADSELRKVFLELRNETAEFHDLKIDTPSSLHYRDIDLQNLVLMGEWPFTVIDSNLTLHDSNYLFLQPSGASTIRLVNSNMVEFIPRNFTGRMIFENSTWNTAGEIIGGVDYHSQSNNFTITGSLKMDSKLKENLRWQNAQVTREYEVLLTDAGGHAVSPAVVRISGRDYPVDAGGKARFSIVFDERNYNVLTGLQALVSGTVVDQQGVNFFTETPIRLKQ